MKRATGELSSTIIVVISVAILIAFFYMTIWPTIRNNFRSQTACEKATCSKRPDSDGMVDCTYKGSSFKCVYKG